VPGTRRLRLSVVAGNLRIHRLLDKLVTPGASVIDVGAYIGYNTIHAARRAGPYGRVVAVEPAADNLEVLRENVAAAGVANVVVAPVACGKIAGTRDLFLSGSPSSVKSLFAESCHAGVTEVVPVDVVPLDDLTVDADVVKIDVEGAELDVLEGMPRLLQRPPALIVEWHPLIQRLAGYAAAALPRWLLERGWQLHAASHMNTRQITAVDLAPLAARLWQQRRAVELVALRR
jgi:FkbM family methyltransferase